MGYRGSGNHDKVIAIWQTGRPDGLTKPSFCSITYHCASYSSSGHQPVPDTAWLSNRPDNHQVTHPTATTRRQDGAETGRGAERNGPMRRDACGLLHAVT